MTRLFALEELVGRSSLPEDVVRDKRRISTGSSRLAESAAERRTRQDAKAWEDLLEALQQSSVNRLELLHHRRGDDLVPCPWGRLAPCDAACRCAGSRSVTVGYLRDHYAHLVTAVASCVSVGATRQLQDEVKVGPEVGPEIAGTSKETETSPKASSEVPAKGAKRRRLPRWQSHWTGETRLRYANARYAQLLAMLCDRDAASLSPEDRGTGRGLCAVCRHVFLRSRLEIDHVDGALWDPRSCSAWVRAARFWQEHEAGVRLRVLCQKCGVASPACRGTEV